MNQRRNLAIAIAATIVFAACGSSGQAPLKAGEISLNSSSSNEGTTAARHRIPGPEDLGPDAPDYCRTIDKMRDAESVSEQEAIELVAEFLDGLGKQGPVDLRDELGAMADRFHSVVELGFDKFMGDPNALTDEERDMLIQVGSDFGQLERLSEELLPVLREECGADFIDSMPGDIFTRASGTQSGSEDDGQPDVGAGTATPSFAGEPFEQVVGGSFGSGRFNHTDFEITGAEWSNRHPDQFGDKEAVITQADVDRRFIYLTIDLLNNDSNDRVLVADEHLTLIVDDGRSIPATEVTDALDAVTFLEPASSYTRIFGFEVGEVTPTEQLTLRFANNALPGFIKVSGDGEPSPYPVTLDPPAPGEFVGSLFVGCDVVYTWTVDTATVLLDRPADYESFGNQMNSRTKTGMRWLLVDGFITTGEAPDGCTARAGVVGHDMLRLVVDGKPVAPLEAPIRQVSAQESIEVTVLWEIPADAAELAIQALGPRGDMFESPFPSFDIPAALGE